MRVSPNRRKIPQGKVSFLIIAIFIFVLTSSSAGQSSRISWKRYSDAISEASQRGRHVILYFYDEFCFYCKKMEKETFSDPKVIRTINEGFVAARLRAKDNKALMRRYFIRVFPTIWFLTPGGEPVFSLPGFFKPDTFVRILNYVEGRFYKKETLQSFLEGS